MENFTLRRAVASDAAALTDLALRSKASNGYDSAFMDACRAELTYTAQTISAGETWLIDAGDRILGFFDLRPLEGDGEVHAMFVEPSAKRAGIGRKLWDALETCARAAGFRSITLDADPFAETFYQSMGMVIVGRSPSGSIPGRFLSRMEKRLLHAAV